MQSHPLTRASRRRKLRAVPVLVSRRHVSRTAIASKSIATRAERMLHALDLETAELSILLCDDATIHALNRDHRRRDKPTDVLAFAMREASEGAWEAGVLGDIVISLDTAAKQARERKRPLWDEVTMLLAHGLLHLLGFDHGTRAEERRMTARTDLLIAAAQPRRGRRA